MHATAITSAQAPDFAERAVIRTEKLRAIRRHEMGTLRAVWPHVGHSTRALMLELRAQLWQWHPAAIAVERSAGERVRRAFSLTGGDR